ncbi:MAG: hypothetical protein KAT28_05475 [Candidatus Aenigmarchaeota archaeon]|nr:hypothetical protein [Candidatus Aenigmarchaeota archaeon]
MKNKQLFLIILMIIFVFIVIGYSVFSYIKPIEEKMLSCESLGVHGYCIEVEFKTTTDREGVSEFSFPKYLRYGDFLWIDKIIIIKKTPDTTEKISGTTLKFDITPTQGHLEDVRGSNYGEFNPRIREEINVGDKYEIKKMEDGKYYHFFNENKIFEESHWKIELYRVGEWYITFNAKGNLTGWTTLYNGRWHGEVFYVHPAHEIENVLYSNRTMALGIISLLAIIGIFLIELIINWNLKSSDNKEEIKREKQN